MEVATEVTEIERQAAASSVKMADVLRRAEVASTTWGRWTSGKFEPRASTLRKVRRALHETINEQATAA